MLDLPLIYTTLQCKKTVSYIDILGMFTKRGISSNRPPIIFLLKNKIIFFKQWEEQTDKKIFSNKGKIFGNMRIQKGEKYLFKNND